MGHTSLGVSAPSNSASVDRATLPEAGIPAARSLQRTPAPRRPVEGFSSAQLVIKRGHRAGTGLVITAAATTIGRHSECDIELDDITVSRRHAEIQFDGNSYVLVDGDSLNGTYLNREPVVRAELFDGDEIWVGKIRFTFRVNA